MPCLLETLVVASEVESVVLAEERVAVRCGVAGVLKIILTEILVRLHVEGLRVDIHDEVESVVVYLSSCVCSEKFMSLRKAHVTHERILELADYGSRLVVAHHRAEAYSSVLNLHSEGEVHPECLSPVYEVFVCNGDYITLLRHCRGVFCAVNLHFLLLVGVVEHPPEAFSGSIVVSGLFVDKRQERTVFSDLHLDVSVTEDEAWSISS